MDSSGLPGGDVVAGEDDTRSSSSIGIDAGVVAMPVVVGGSHSLVATQTGKWKGWP